MKSAELLGMEMAYTAEEIVEAVKTTVKVNHIGRGIVKMLAYWGGGGRHQTGVGFKTGSGHLCHP